MAQIKGSTEDIQRLLLKLFGDVAEGVGIDRAEGRVENIKVTVYKVGNNLIRIDVLQK